MDHIISHHVGQLPGNTRHEGDTTPFAFCARQIYVTGIVLPEITVGHHGDLMPQLTQSVAQRGMYITVFSQQEYLQRCP